MSDLARGSPVFITEEGPYYGQRGVIVGGGVELSGEPEYYLVRTGLGDQMMEVNIPRQSLVTYEERRNQVMQGRSDYA